jgi:uncharacterized protein YbaP (TraB family)
MRKPMLRFLVAFTLVTLTSTALPRVAYALCEARDIINDMPAEQRALLEAEVAKTPFPEGLYWQARRGQTTITMFGTYHFRHAETDNHLDALKPEIAAADVVYLEMSNEEQQNFEKTVASDPSIMFITEGPTLPDLLGEEDWLKFRSEMMKRNFPGVVSAKLKPIWGALMLGIGPCEAQNGAMDSEGIDALIGTYAEAEGIESKSLEDFRTILTLLDEDPIEKQVEMIRLTLNYPGDPDDMSYTIRERYLNGEIALTWQLTKDISLQYGGPTAQQDMDKLEQVMLTDRNRKWVDLLSGLSEPKRIFAAFGAGHLPGENGVLYMLEQEGFEITRLAMPRQ